jgi:two-component system, OmpR family, response regulator
VSDVVILKWPDEQTEVDRLRRLGLPHLLLVEPGADPPEADDFLADWVLLPSDERDLRARLARLRRRADRFERPRIDDSGRLLFRDRWVPLAPTEERLAHPFVDQYGRLVRDEELIQRAYPAPPPPTSFRVQLSRLRRRIRPLGLTIRTMSNRGHVLEAADADL